VNKDGAAILKELAGGLIVSVQAKQGSPLCSTPIIAAIAAAVLEGQPAGLRINGPDHVRAVRELTQLPIIGLHKVHVGARNIITAQMSHALGLAEAGADIIAVDATNEVLGEDFSYLTRVMEETGLPVMADVSTFDEGLRAWDVGAMLVSTTLSGYTPESRSASSGPDLVLVSELTRRSVRVTAEGRYRSPEDIDAAFALGAFAVIVGGAITDPGSITSSYVKVSPRSRVLGV
jgi:N-acylglucosamine-6-phosphate 2-epimerase